MSEKANYGILIFINFTKASIIQPTVFTYTQLPKNISDNIILMYFFYFALNEENHSPIQCHDTIQHEGKTQKPHFPQSIPTQ